MESQWRRRRVKLRLISLHPMSLPPVQRTVHDNTETSSSSVLLMSCFVVMNVPVILKTVTFLWSVNCSSHPSQPFMFNWFFFIMSFVIELSPLRLNAWLSYKRSDIPFFAFIEKCDFAVCLFYKFSWCFVLHEVWALFYNDVNCYERIVNVLHYLILFVVFCDLSSVYRKAACYNSLLFVFALWFREFACSPAPNLTLKVVNEVCSWFCGYIPGKQWQVNPI